ncbi:CGNR zinc finger domain-containing protein [Phormidesmis sp. 146-12]
MEPSANESTQQDWSQLKRVSGWLCLNFVNTVDRQFDREATGYSEDWFTDYADLVAWGQQTQILSKPQVNRLLQFTAQQPDLANVVFEDAIALRETIYCIFSAIAAKQEVAKGDLDRLNTVLKEALPWQQLVSTAEGFVWTWVDCDRLDCILWRVVRSASDLLTAKELKQVRECSGEDCGWLFVDTSRNRSRRWCDMETCGNRAKAHRHYERCKQKSESMP